VSQDKSANRAKKKSRAPGHKKKVPQRNKAPTMLQRALAKKKRDNTIKAQGMDHKNKTNSGEASRRKKPSTRRSPIIDKVPIAEEDLKRGITVILKDGRELNIQQNPDGTLTIPAAQISAGEEHIFSGESSSGEQTAERDRQVEGVRVGKDSDKAAGRVRGSETVKKNSQGTHSQGTHSQGTRGSEFAPSPDSALLKSPSTSALLPNPPPGTGLIPSQRKRSGEHAVGRGNVKITDGELRTEIEAGLTIPEIASRYGMSRKTLYPRVRRMEQNTLDAVLIGETEAGEPVLNFREQIAFINRATMDILRSARTSTNLKLTAVKRIEAQNDLQARLNALIMNVQETRAFQETVLETILELEETFPGIRETLVQKLRERKDLTRATTP